MSDKWRLYDEVLQDERGRILGHAKTFRRPLNKAERDACEKFLRGITSARRDNAKEQTVSRNQRTATRTSAPASKPKQDQCNIVYLAGTIQSIRVDQDSGFILVDAGTEKKFVPCTIYKSEILADHLAKFERGNIIRIVGYVRPWSVKDEATNTWQNRMEVRITEIKNDPPEQREPVRQPAGGPGYDTITDDDIPF